MTFIDARYLAPRDALEASALRRMVDEANGAPNDSAPDWGRVLELAGGDDGIHRAVAVIWAGAYIEQLVRLESLARTNGTLSALRDAEAWGLVRVDSDVEWAGKVRNELAHGVSIPQKETSEAACRILYLSFVRVIQAARPGSRIARHGYLWLQKGHAIQEAREQVRAAAVDVLLQRLQREHLARIDELAKRQGAAVLLDSLRVIVRDEAPPPSNEGVALDHARLLVCVVGGVLLFVTGVLFAAGLG